MNLQFCATILNIAVNPDRGWASLWASFYCYYRANPVINKCLIADVCDLINEINPFAQAYRMMKDEEFEKARIGNRSPMEIGLLLIQDKSLHKGTMYQELKK